MLRELIRLTVRRVLWHLSPTRRDEAIQLAINHIVPTKFVVRMKKTSSGWTVKPEGLSDITVKQDGHIERNHIGNFSAATRYNGRLLTKKLLRKISAKVKAGWSLKRIAESLNIQPESLVWLLQQSNAQSMPISRQDWTFGNDLEIHDWGAFRQAVSGQVPVGIVRHLDDSERKREERAEKAKAEGREVGKPGKPKISEERLKSEIASGLRYPSGKLKPKPQISDNPSSSSRVENN